MHRDKYPEQIPFRLTRMLVNAMEVSGIEGSHCVYTSVILMVVCRHFSFHLRERDARAARQQRESDGRARSIRIRSADQLASVGTGSTGIAKCHVGTSESCSVVFCFR